jgi:hypothetical protein
MRLSSVAYIVFDESLANRGLNNEGQIFKYDEFQNASKTLSFI